MADANTIASEETKKITEYLTATEKAVGTPAKLAIINDLFAYLTTTTEILKRPGFRGVVWQKIYEVEPRAEVKDASDQLRIKLLEYGPAFPKPLGKAPISPALKYIAKGSYGCAVEPALPNEVNGSWKTYPSNVSKLFFKKRNYDKLLAKRNMITNVFGEGNDYKITPYKHKFAYTNIPDRIRHNCNMGAQELHMVRMPHLGISVHKANKGSVEYGPLLRAIPVQTLLNEIMKLFGNVKTLRDKKIIHGDIRETNVMIDPNTGKLTIIDFDWLLPEADFLAQYGGFGFYNNPPEALMVDRLERLANLHILEDFFDEMDADGEAEEYIQKSNLYKYRKDIGVEVDMYTLTGANMENLTHVAKLAEAKEKAKKPNNEINYLSNNKNNKNNNIKPQSNNNNKQENAVGGGLNSYYNGYNRYNNYNNYYNQYSSERQNDILKAEFLKTFDSYGLGITLAALLYAIYPEEFKAQVNVPIYTLIHTIVKPMIALEMENRMDIDKAINELGTLQGQAQGGGKRKQTRSKKRATRKTRKNRK